LVFLPVGDFNVLDDVVKGMVVARVAIFTVPARAKSNNTAHAVLITTMGVSADCTRVPAVAKAPEMEASYQWAEVKLMAPLVGYFNIPKLNPRLVEVNVFVVALVWLLAASQYHPAARVWLIVMV
jgi:hypothetical protein